MRCGMQSPTTPCDSARNPLRIWLLFARDHAATCKAFFAAAILRFTPPTANQATRVARVASPAWGAHEDAGRAGVMVAGRGNPPAAPLLAGSSSAVFVERGRNGSSNANAWIPRRLGSSPRRRGTEHSLYRLADEPVCILAPDPGFVNNTASRVAHALPTTGE